MNNVEAPGERPVEGRQSGKGAEVHTASAVLASVYAVLLFVSAGGKLVRAEFQMATLRKVGVADKMVPWLAVAEIAGGVGLLVGLWCWPIAVAAAVGLVLYFLGAVLAHLRVRDWNIGSGAVMLAIAIAVLVLRVVSR
jgi:uncharacterized membrane protein YphA (DoxX/SURF4 family)